MKKILTAEVMLYTQRKARLISVVLHSSDDDANVVFGTLVRQLQTLGFKLVASVAANKKDIGLNFMKSKMSFEEQANFVGYICDVIAVFMRGFSGKYVDSITRDKYYDTFRRFTVIIDEVDNAG